MRPPYVGLFSSANDAIDGSISELILYERNLDAGERTQLEAYFSSRYGL